MGAAQMIVSEEGDDMVTVLKRSESEHTAESVSQLSAEYGTKEEVEAVRIYTATGTATLEPVECQATGHAAAAEQQIKADNEMEAAWNVVGEKMQEQRVHVAPEKSREEAEENAGKPAQEAQRAVEVAAIMAVAARRKAAKEEENRRQRQKKRNAKEKKASAAQEPLDEPDFVTLSSM